MIMPPTLRVKIERAAEDLDGGDDQRDPAPACREDEDEPASSK